MKILLCIQSFIVGLIQTKLSALRILLQSNFIGIIQQESQTKPLLILGNGPSLNDTLSNNPAATLQGFDLMAVNAAACSEQFSALQPKLYILNAVTYFQNDSELSPFYIQAKNDLFEALKEKTRWNMTLLVPFRAKKSIDFQMLITSNPNLNVGYFNQTPVEGLSFWSHSWYNLGWGMPRPHNVLIPGIMVGIRLGYKTIGIVGADHSWLADLSVNENNEALLRHVHYYATDGTQPMKVEDRIDRPRKLHEIIHKFYLSFKGYWQIKTYAKAKQVSIINASSTSMIDAFDRKTLGQMLSASDKN
ncbi:MAG: hypothetical protein K9I97_04740 [Cryomorphaceae bacterium]|jgi:hypothetical protein|nr:hypothetical protein [Cryomorphaceae bacterium]